MLNVRRLSGQPDDVFRPVTCHQFVRLDFVVFEKVNQQGNGIGNASDDVGRQRFAARQGVEQDDGEFALNVALRTRERRIVMRRRVERRRMPVGDPSVDLIDDQPISEDMKERDDAIERRRGQNEVHVHLVHGEFGENFDCQTLSGEQGGMQRIDRLARVARRPMQKPIDQAEQQIRVEGVQNQTAGDVRQGHQRVLANVRHTLRPGEGRRWLLFVDCFLFSI